MCDIVFVAYAKQVYWFGLGEEGYARIAADTAGIIRSKVFPGLWLQEDLLRTNNLAEMLKTLQEGLNSSEHADFVQRLTEGNSFTKQ